MRLRNIGLFCLFLIGAVLAAAVGLSFPIHFRAVSPILLEEAAVGTPTLEQRADDFLNAGQTGPVLMLARADTHLLEEPWRSERLGELLDAYPQYRYSGGPAPYFERFLEGTRRPSTHTGAPILPLILPREHRQRLLGFLETTSNATVGDLLATRHLAGYQHFLPVFSAAGHPLDASILTTALLEQSNAWQPGISRELRALTRIAGEDPAALSELERIYLAVLTLASRADWTQLTELLRHVPDPDSLHQLAGATHQEDGEFATLYGAIVLSGNAPAILSYLEQRPDDGWRVMRFALGLGAGALETMATFEQPLYDPPEIIGQLPLDPIEDLLKGFTEENPRGAMALKVVAMLIAGYFLARALVLLVTLFRQRHPGATDGASLEQLFYAFSAAAVAVLIGVIAEPRLLEFAPTTASELRLSLAQILPESTPPSSSSEPGSPMFDQVTLIVLLMFFVLQLAVFTFSLLKLREIKAQDLPASVKLSLLENEDSLFDLGLYIGLGGTVASLTLVVMELLDASLMAAYTSTLFGIIFVALLKIFFLRPFRRRLILEASGNKRLSA